MKAKTPLALTSINNIIKNPLMLMIKYRPFPCPPPSSPISSIRSSCCLRSRIRSLPPSLVIEETSPVSDIDIETDSQSVSRRLILLRHAKSSWDDRSLRDHDRPLSKSGELDAAKVSQKLQQLDWIPQLILSSDALRTKETLRIMQQQVPDFLDAEVHFISSFYSIAAMDGQTADHLQQTICNYSRDGILTVMCMGHNRGWEEAASMFSGASIELKTCNAALLEAPGKSWEEAFASAGLGGWKFQGMLCLSVLSLHQRPNHNPYTPPPPVSGNDSTTTHTASNESQTRTRSLTLKKKDNPENWYEFYDMIDQFINFVIRPPRADYNPDQYLWEKEFTLSGRTYKRQDLEAMTVLNSKPDGFAFPMQGVIPCDAVITYLHLSLKILPFLALYTATETDANEAAVILLPSNITVFTLDFSGSGLSDGDYVSLGWHERDDLKVVVSYLRSNKQISCIGLWGRSMGAVTSLLYGAEDPSIAGMVLDSAFANLFDLMMELVDVYKIRLPKFTVKMAVQYMRRVIQKKAKFDIMDLNCLKVAPKTFIPALFGHASEDKFIQPHHADLIFKSYAGDKNMIKFDGDHNSSRPQFYYDSVSIFFFNVLHPPQTSTSSNKLEKYYDLGDLKVSAGMDEILLYEIITGQRSACTDAASSSSVPPSIPTKKPVSKLLYEIAPFANVVGKSNGQSEECCSYTSSNRESWGRCSSLGGSDEECPAECRAVDNSHEMTLKAFATPLRSIQQKSPDPTKEEEKKKKKKALTVPKKLKGEKFEKLEAFSKRLRHCILRRGNHQRHCSS
uniref:Serine aminopeptidase S33 domain-containing protein n=1 Tax=Salix viminalis TaxID=40686 RepID=A0A6N2K3K0_SALVM